MAGLVLQKSQWWWMSDHLWFVWQRPDLDQTVEYYLNHDKNSTPVVLLASRQATTCDVSVNRLILHTEN